MFMLLLFTTSCAGNLPKVDAKTDPDFFRSDAARVELRKPKDWHFTTIDTTLSKLANLNLEDEEVQRTLLARGAMPIMTATKHVEPYDRPNPVIRMTMRSAGPLAGKSGVELLEVLAPKVTQELSGAIVDPVHGVRVGGTEGGRMTVRYTMHAAGGRDFPIQTTTVVVPRKTVFYLFEFSGSQDGEDVVTNLVEPVLATVRFLD
jgi:hypothetical protein